MSKSDWRSPDAYAIIQDAEAADLAWEFLRHNSHYREDHRKLHSDGSLFAVSRKFRHRWGLSFRGRSPPNFQNANRFLVTGGASDGAQGSCRDPEDVRPTLSS